MSKKDNWDWLVADKEGLAQLVERRGSGGGPGSGGRGKAFVVGELLQNAWDEEGVTEVTVDLEALAGKALAVIDVADDAPAGWENIEDSYRLFAPSKKKKDPTKRGRFNLGEKLVLAICQSAEIVSMNAAMTFDNKGRRPSKKRRPKGTHFHAVVRMTHKDAAEVHQFVQTLIPPKGIITYYNEEEIPHRDPVAVVPATLPTEIEDEQGNLRPSKRKTTVEIYHPNEDEEGMLYEMGIPIVETGDKYHVNVMQKVPLNMDRDNVRPSYLKKIRTLVFNEMSDDLETEDVNEAWVQSAVADPDCEPEAVKQYKDKKYGKKAVIHDPSDPEADAIAASKGYVVVHGGSESKATWKNLKGAEALKPAGQVTPSKKIDFHPNGKNVTVPYDKWSEGMKQVAEFTQDLAQKLIGQVISVSYLNDPRDYGACYGEGGTLSYNLRRLGRKHFAEGPTPAIVELIIHELGHHFESNHLSEDYYRALCRLGVKLAKLALDEPDFFEEVW
jgi:hypothetical protein